MFHGVDLFRFLRLQCLQLSSRRLHALVVLTVVSVLLLELTLGHLGSARGVLQLRLHVLGLLQLFVTGLPVRQSMIRHELMRATLVH